MPQIKTAFLAYRHSGADPAVLEPMLSGVVEALKASGVDVYCTFFDDEHVKAKLLNPKDVMQHAFGIIEQKDALLVIQASDEKSEGMLLEVGRFMGQKLIIIGTHASVSKTYLPELADSTFRWETQQQLQQGFLQSIRAV